MILLSVMHFSGSDIKYMQLWHLQKNKNLMNSLERQLPFFTLELCSLPGLDHHLQNEGDLSSSLSLGGGLIVWPRAVLRGGARGGGGLVILRAEFLVSGQRKGFWVDGLCRRKITTKEKAIMSGARWPRYVDGDRNAAGNHR